MKDGVTCANHAEAWYLKPILRFSYRHVTLDESIGLADLRICHLTQLLGVKSIRQADLPLSFCQVQVALHEVREVVPGVQDTTQVVCNRLSHDAFLIRYNAVPLNLSNLLFCSKIDWFDLYEFSKAAIIRILRIWIRF